MYVAASVSLASNIQRATSCEYLTHFLSAVPSAPKSHRYLLSIVLISTQDQMKSQDLDILQRVEDLSNSVQELCNQQQPQGIPHSTSVNSLRVIRESHLETGSIETISESSDSEEDDQSFEEYCRTNLALIGDRRVSTTSTTTVLSSVKIVIGSVDDDRAEQSVLNNSPYVITHKAQSYLSDDSDRDFERSEELSMKSEPLMITHAEHLACTVTPVH